MEMVEFLPVEPGKHTLPPLPYAYDALEPILDAKIIELHHDIHHKKIVENLNKAELAMVTAREMGDYTYVQHWENQLAFNGSGHILHSIYWTIMTPPQMGGSPGETTLNWINWYFGNFDAFKAQFLAATKKVEGSGWGILGYNPAFGHLEILQCGNFQNLTQWGIIPILVCDVWEHSYYLQYQSKRDDYVDKWWDLVNWNEVERRLICAYHGRLPLTME